MTGERVEIEAGVQHPAIEAQARAGEGYGARVLEPSPPAIDDGVFFADDPVNDGIPGEPVVSPVGGDLTWDDLVTDRGDESLAAWAAERWLAGSRPLPPLPDRLVEVRSDLHRLATYVVAPARHQATGKFGLRWTLGGFGTPFFGDDTQVRVHGDRLVVQRGDTATAAPITTLRAGAELIGSAIDAEIAAEHDSPPIGDIEAKLNVSADVVQFLDAWWGMGTAALELVRADTASVDATRVQLWPGHFDPAIEIGDEDRRASFGASPGDASSDEPYLYVALWWPDRLDLDADDPFWSAPSFTGARLDYRALADSDSPRTDAADFFRSVRDRIAETRATPEQDPAQP
jgi:hypothetical protein